MTAAAAAIGTLIAGIRDEQLELTTPSPAYRVADLVEHVDSLAWGLQLTARKAEVPVEQLRDGDGTLLRPGWRERVPAELTALAAASGMFVLDELLVHGWELAAATGQPFDPDPAAVTATAAFLRGFPRTAESAELFGPIVEVPDGAPELDRLVGLTGRDPAWRP